GLHVANPAIGLRAKGDWNTGTVRARRRTALRRPVGAQRARTRFARASSGSSDEPGAWMESGRGLAGQRVGDAGLHTHFAAGRAQRGALVTRAVGTDIGAGSSVGGPENQLPPEAGVKRGSIIRFHAPAPRVARAHRDTAALAGRDRSDERF